MRMRSEIKRRSAACVSAGSEVKRLTAASCSGPAGTSSILSRTIAASARGKADASSEETSEDGPAASSLELTAR